MRIVETIESFASDHPIATVGAAIVVGAVVGALLGRREPREPSSEQRSLLGRVAMFGIRSAAMAAARRALHGLLEGADEEQPEDLAGPVESQAHH